MPRLHAIELLPDATGAAMLRAEWLALRDAGLPSQLDHTGTSNTPHVTVIAVPQLDADDEQLAIDLLGPLLPLQVGLSGLALLGERRLTVARLVDVSDELVAAVLRLRAGTRGHDHPGWLPHVSLARRVAREDAQRAVDALVPDAGRRSGGLMLSTLRRWDPDAGTVTALLGQTDAGSGSRSSSGSPTGSPPRGAE